MTYNKKDELRSPQEKCHLCGLNDVTRHGMFNVTEILNRKNKGWGPSGDGYDSVLYNVNTRIIEYHRVGFCKKCIRKFRIEIAFAAFIFFAFPAILLVGSFQYSRDVFSYFSIDYTKDLKIILIVFWFATSFYTIFVGIPMFFKSIGEIFSTQKILDEQAMLHEFPTLQKRFESRGGINPYGNVLGEEWYVMIPSVECTK